MGNLLKATEESPGTGRNQQSGVEVRCCGFPSQSVRRMLGALGIKGRAMQARSPGSGQSCRKGVQLALDAP